MDFTLKKYNDLLIALKESGMTFKIRHDVDLRPSYSLRTAYIEHDINICSTYYFRAVPESFDRQIIAQIAKLGHKIGYHYESLSTTNGNMEAAYEDFKHNLEIIREIASVDCICMHGSPKSKWDNRELWKHYDYRNLGIVNEPYLDTDWSKTLYLTDTGRRWDGYKVSVRDKIPQWQEIWNQKGLTYHSTNDIVNALLDANSNLRRSNLEIHITTHPQRWCPLGFAWFNELVSQNCKNMIKCIMARNTNRK